MTVSSSPQPQVMLSVQNLSVSYNSRQGLARAVRDVSFELQRGEIFAVVGESGSGKSTMAQALMGLLPTTAAIEGTLMLAGENIAGLAPRKRRALCGERMALISQDALAALNPCTTVGYQIAETLMVHRSQSKTSAMREAIRLLDLVGVPSPSERAHHYPHQFSGGMRQRALIAIALTLQPDVLVADEPTTALDATIKAQILDLLMRLRSELGMSIIVITHDMGVVARMADRVMVMYAGKAVETGQVLDVFAAPAHPYTQALLVAMPRLDSRLTALSSIGGSPPSPTALPSGCAFHPRCPRTEFICCNTAPAPLQVGSTISLCHFDSRGVANAAQP